jgi:hypothetical protein
MVQGEPAASANHRTIGQGRQTSVNAHKFCSHFAKKDKLCVYHVH